MNHRIAHAWIVALAVWGWACLSPLPTIAAEGRDSEEWPRQEWVKWLEGQRGTQLAQIIRVQAVKAVLPPYMVCTLAIGEGLGRRLDAIITNGVLAIRNKVHGFGYLRLDFFCADIARLKKEGLIRTNLDLEREYDCIVGTNDFGRRVLTGSFNGVNFAVEAFVACIAHNRRLFNYDHGNLQF